MGKSTIFYTLIEKMLMIEKYDCVNLLSVCFLYQNETLIVWLINDLLTPLCRVLLAKLTGLQIVKKYPTFHGTRRFITALTSVCHLSILGQPNPVHIPTSHLLEICPNIIHPSTPSWLMTRELNSLMPLLIVSVRRGNQIFSFIIL